MAEPYTVPLPGGIPSNHREHTESRTTILLPTDRSAFLNPPQQFNRDLSVAVIRAWNERRVEAAKAHFEQRQTKRRKPKPKSKPSAVEGEVEQEGEVKQDDEVKQEVVVREEAQAEAGPSVPSIYHPKNIKIIEALSATGLRSIRYAKEIPNVRMVLANDLSPSACDAMRMNVTYNGVAEEETQPGAVPATHNANPEPEVKQEGKEAEGIAGPSTSGKAEKKKTPWTTLTEDENGLLPNGRRADCKGRVKVNEGDACTLMYSHRDVKNRVDVVDLDPYGTAAPFIDAAVSCIADGGLLCVTCTDVAVLAGSQYPEKAYANYGGASVNAEYCHEVALRLVLNMLATTAARYGRCITPLLSFSIDFYVRVFVTVDTSPIRVKELSSNTGVIYVCSHCQTYEAQPFGRQTLKGTNKVFKSAAKTSKSGTCELCGSTQHLGGPMWLGPIHDHEFAARCLKSIEGQQGDYATWKRMHGMLLVAQEELDEPFYFTCNRISSFFKASSAPSNKAVYAANTSELDCADVRHALLNAGYQVSRSHAAPGSIKTDAPRTFVLDIIREFIKENPVNVDKIPKGNPAHVLLAQNQTHKVDFTPNAGWAKYERGEKVVFYQANPEPNWGPAARAKTVKKGPAGSVADAIKAATTTSTALSKKIESEGELKRKGEDDLTPPEAKKAKEEASHEEVSVSQVPDDGDDEEEMMNA